MIIMLAKGYSLSSLDPPVLSSECLSRIAAATIMHEVHAGFQVPGTSL